MKILTTTSKRVQSFFKITTKKFQTAKEKRLNQLIECHEFLDEIFPMKQWRLLDEIVFLTAETGVTNITVKKLIERTGVSERTISTFNNNLKSTGEYIIARLKNSRTNCGGFVYIDRKHEDFKEIMEHLFGLDDIQATAMFPEQNAEEIAEQKNVETVDTKGFEGKKQDYHYYNLNKSNNLNNNTYSNGNKENEGNKNRKGNDKFNALRNTINGLLEKYNFPKSMLNKFASIAGRIKRDFKNKLQESLIDSLIVKAFKALSTAHYNNAEAFYSWKLTTLIKNAINPLETLTKPSNSQIEVSETTNVIEQQEKIMKAKIANSKNKNIPDWFGKDSKKLKSTMDYDAKMEQIKAKLGM